MRCLACIALILTTILTTPACVTPVRTFDSYEGKAADTAKDALSAIQTARLMATAAAHGRSLAAYASVVLAEAEEQATAVQGTFDSIQPPDSRADSLRKDLDALLEAAAEHLGTLRIEVRRGRLERLNELAAPLAAVAGDLEAFQKAHG